MKNFFAASLLLTLVVGFASLASAQQWYKGNLHMHTLWSDGDAAPEVAVAWYLEHGWHFICLTDHNIQLVGERFLPIDAERDLKPEHVESIKAQFGEDWVEIEERLGELRMRLKTFAELEERFAVPGEFLLIPGEELTTLGGNPHVNGINTIERIGAITREEYAKSTRSFLRSVAEQGERLDRPVLAVLNHPGFSDGITVEEAVSVEELRFFEVYNGHPSVNNWGHEGRGYPSMDRYWDIVLSLRLRDDPEYMLYGLATDDAHNYHSWRVGRANPGRGWVMVRAETLDTSSLLAAMEKGDFYASTGVVLEEVRRDETGLSLRIQREPGVVYITRYVGTRRDFDMTSTPMLDESGGVKERASRVYSDDIGVTLLETEETVSSYTFTGDELYVRAIVISDKQHPNPFKEGDVEMAWTQPTTPRKP